MTATTERRRTAGVRMKRIGWTLAVLAACAATALPARAQSTPTPEDQAQQVARGKAVFESQCSICHSAEEGRNKTGPSLFSVVGRRAGRVEGFAYSDANRNSGVVWTVETLDLYLTRPKGVVPHNAMTYGGIQDAGKRADLIAYLATLR